MTKYHNKDFLNQKIKQLNTIYRQVDKRMISDIPKMDSSDFVNKHFRNSDGTPYIKMSEQNTVFGNRIPAPKTPEQNLKDEIRTRFNQDLVRHSIAAERKVTKIHSEFKRGLFDKNMAVKRISAATLSQRKADKMAIVTRNQQLETGMFIQNTQDSGVTQLRFTILGKTCPACKAFSGKVVDIKHLDPLRPNMKRALGTRSKEDFLKQQNNTSLNAPRAIVSGPPGIKETPKRQATAERLQI